MKIAILISHPFELWFNQYVFQEVSRKFGADSVTLILASGQGNSLDYSSLVSELYGSKVSIIHLGSVKITKSLKLIKATLGEKTKIKRRLANHFKKGEATVIMHDKSRLTSRIIASHFKKVVLIQNQDSKTYLNEKNFHYSLDLKETLRDLFFSKILQISSNKIYRIKDTNSSVYVKNKMKSAKVVYRSGPWITGKSICINERRDMSNSESNEGTILIFGFRFTSWGWMTDEMLQQTLLKIEEYIGMYPDFEIFYLPHPRESEEEFRIIEKAITRKMRNIGKGVPAEIVLEKVKSIQVCIGFGSTALSSAQSLGVFALSLFQEIDCPQSVKKIYESILNSNFTKEYPNSTDMQSLINAIKE
jgi:hypothetical protein